MKKILSLVVVVVMAWAGVDPAHAAPMRQTGNIIECWDGEVQDNCEQLSPTLIKITITQTGDRDAWWKLYELSYLYVVIIWNDIHVTNTYLYGSSARIDVIVPNIEGVQYPLPAEGSVTIPATVTTHKSAEPMISQYSPIRTASGIETPGVIATYQGAVWWIYLSVEPISSCPETYLTLTDDTYAIDPTIESPLGPEGTPADEQIANVAYSQWYKLFLTGGPWNDGTSDREDVAISWDGDTWEELPPPLCGEQMEDGTYVDVWYLISESDTFYIRANDEDGQFADNTEVNLLEYTIGITVIVQEATCESQFEYGAEDWVASVQVHADVDETLATTELLIGGWYAIEVANGTWQDDGVGPPRTDMEYANYTDQYESTKVWGDLSGGIGNAWCQTEDGLITFVQARANNLDLRVNNEAGGWEANTGVLGVNIYAATFTRSQETCETVFERAQLVSTGVVNANQENGKQFAYAVGGSIMSIGLEPGAWYYLETTGGSWAWKGALHQDNAYSYDMAVSEDGDTWVPLEAWTRPLCNISLDGLGHRGVYFQIPETAAVEWFLRVDDDAIWFNNIGSMSWNLYGASRLNVELSPGDACDFSWSDDFIRGAWIDATLEDGAPLYLYPTESTSYYAIKIKGNDYHWLEQTGGDPQYGMQASTNDGANWYDFPSDYSGSLCTITTGNETTTFVKVVDGQQWRMRVDSSSFTDNDLGMQIEIYAANPGNTLDPWTECFAGASLFTLNTLQYIPVKEEGGIYINGTNVLQGGNEIQLLQPTETYKLEIQEGPWTNGEGQSSYDAAISSDNGVTWYAISDRENPDIICGGSDFIGAHRYVYFTVQEGQKWKIRVNDNVGEFLDNDGNLGYRLYSAYGDEDVPPVDVMIPPSVVNNVCVAPLIRPSSILEVSAWVNYSRLAIQKYFAWCPQHTNIILALFAALQTKEPFATLSEGVGTIASAKEEIRSYNWGVAAGEDLSILTRPPGESYQMFVDHAYAPITSENPWETGIVDLTSFQDFEMPASYTACQQYLSPQAGTKLAQGVCYASAVMLMTGASFWVQLLLDVAAFIAIFKLFLGEVQKLISMLTGVSNISVNVKTPPMINDIQDEYRSLRRKYK